MTISKLNIPSWYKNTFGINIGNAPTISGLNKIVAVHSINNEITPSQQFARGYTHLPKIWEDDSLNAAQRCYVLLSDVFPGMGHSDAQIRGAAQLVASRVTPASALADQFTEAGSNPIPWADGSYWTVGKKFYQYLCEELGIAGASQHSFFDNYDTKYANFSEFFRIDNGASNPLHPYHVGALASQTGARKKGATNEGGGQVDNPYFTSGMHQWTNNLTMALWSNDLDVKHWLYDKIFNCQVKYAAKSDIKSVWYGSPWAQSLSTPSNEHHKNPGWIHERTGGYWKVPNWHIVPPAMMSWLGFFGCLLTEGVYIWEVAINWSNNVSNDRVNPWAPPRTWISTGGGAPALLGEGGGNDATYPWYPQIGCDATLVGVHLYNQVKSIVNASSGIAYASYSTNTGTVGVRPGDPRLFRRGFQNFGQDTILHLANSQKGLALACSGAGQTLLVYINPYLPVTVSENVTIDFNGVSYPLGNLEGGTLHIYVAS